MPVDEATMEAIRKKDRDDPYETIIGLGNSLTINIDPDTECIAIHFTDRKAIDRFWEITCLCGKKDTFPLNGFPEVDTPHSCGNPKHWVVKYEY